MALALGGGLALYAAHPPLDQGWLGLVALVPLLALARLLSAARGLAPALGWGLLAGVACFAPLLSWIARFGAVPWLLLVLIQAAFVAVWLAAVTWWGPRPGRGLYAVLAWVGLEWVRSGWPLGGFPWGVLGYSQHDGGMFLPVARTLGVFGVSLLLAAFAVALEAVLARGLAAWRARPRAAGYGEVLFAAVRTPLLGLLGILVAAVLLSGEVPAPSGETVTAAAVQGNDQDLPPLADRASLDRVERIVDLMVQTTAGLADEAAGLDFVVWPENALDADPRDHPALAAQVDTALELIGDADLIAGTLLDGERSGTFVNAMVHFDGEGDIEEVAVKRKLVPFGEYVPLRRWLEWYPALRHIPRDGVAGTEPTVFRIGDALVAPVTCYESLFGPLVHAQVREGANVVVVSTNNASFGRTAASAQHLAFSQLRAVETGRWVLHAGISGISAVVDPEGATSQETELFERALVSAELPLIEGRTPAVVLGDLVGWLAALLALVAMVVAAAVSARGRGPRRPPRGRESTE